MRKSYETEVKPYLSDIEEWAGLLTDTQIAARLGIHRETFRRYQKAHPEIQEAMARGRKTLVQTLKETLKKKAVGFEYKETKTVYRDVDGKQTKMVEEYRRYSPPDTGAIHLLLKNLDDTWRNDDRETMDLKMQKLELDRKKAEEANW